MIMGHTAPHQSYLHAEPSLAYRVSLVCKERSGAVRNVRVLPHLKRSADLLILRVSGQALTGQQVHQRSPQLVGWRALLALQETSASAILRMYCQHTTSKLCNTSCQAMGGWGVQVWVLDRLESSATSQVAVCCDDDWQLVTSGAYRACLQPLLLSM